MAYENKFLQEFLHRGPQTVKEKLKIIRQFKDLPKEMQGPKKVKRKKKKKTKFALLD